MLSMLQMMYHNDCDKYACIIHILLARLSVVIIKVVLGKLISLLMSRVI